MRLDMTLDFTFKRWVLLEVHCHPSSLFCFLQGLKRLMTICQKHFETDPSKCVEYNAL